MGVAATVEDTGRPNGRGARWPHVYVRDMMGGNTVTDATARIVTAVLVALVCGTFGAVLVNTTRTAAIPELVRTVGAMSQAVQNNATQLAVVNSALLRVDRLETRVERLESEAAHINARSLQNDIEKLRQELTRLREAIRP